jgi:cytochrome b
VLNAGGVTRRVLVWPLWLRVMHGLLAVAVLASLATHEGGGVWHERWGWLALGVAVLRVALGVTMACTRTGPRADGDHRHTALADWWHSPGTVWRYGRTLLQGRAPRYLGHNPLGGWMMLVLLADVLLCGFTGWLFTTDRYWGVAWVAELHGALGQAFMPLLLLHVAGAVVASVKQQENLMASMVHGCKRAPAADDVA